MKLSKQFDAKKRIEELESLIIKFVDNHKNIIKSEDPTGDIVDTYYQMLRDSKEVLNNPAQWRENNGIEINDGEFYQCEDCMR